MKITYIYVFAVLCLIFSSISEAKVTISQGSVFPDYPELLQNSEWKDVKEKFDELDDVVTGIGKAMNNLLKAYNKIDKKKLDASLYFGDIDLNYLNYSVFESNLKNNLKKVVTLEKENKKVKKVVDKYVKKWKKKKTLEDVYEYLKKVSEESKDFEKVLKKIPKESKTVLKSKKANLDGAFAKVESESMPSLKAGIKICRDYIEDTFEIVDEDEGEQERLRKDFFNSDIFNKSRILSTHIGNFLKYKDSLPWQDIDEIKDTYEVLVLWSGGKGRKIGEKGGKETVEEEVGEFSEVLDAIEDWVSDK